MFKVQSLIEIKNFQDLVNLLEYFINRNDLKFYNFLIETNEFGNFKIRRDIEYIYIENEYFEDGLKQLKTYRFNNLDNVINYIEKFIHDIIWEFDIEIFVQDLEKINEILNEIRQFNPTILQITKEIVIYEEFKN